MGKITKQQLSPSLLEYINSNKGGSNITFSKKSVMISEETNSVAIGIQGYNKHTDLLMVYKNTVYLDETIMYTISEDSQYINNSKGKWEANTLFNFIVIKNRGSNNSDNNSNNDIPNSGPVNFEIVDGSITEAKLDQNVKNKLKDINTLKNTVRYKNFPITETDLEQNVKNKLNDMNILKNVVRYKKDYITESDLDKNLREKLNVGGPKTWGALKKQLGKTWGNLMGQ